MDHAIVCPACQGILDPRLRNAVSTLIYRNVSCRFCGMACILEGPEANVAYSRTQPPVRQGPRRPPPRWFEVASGG